MSERKIWKPQPLKKISIIGLGASSYAWTNKCHAEQGLEPVSEFYQRWTVNRGAFIFEHDVAFHMHDFATDTDLLIPDIKQRWQTHPKPFLTTRWYEGYENMYEFPICELVGYFHENYLMNSVAYMSALGIMSIELYRKLNAGGDVQNTDGSMEFFGCDYNYKTTTRFNPYEHGRACVEFWLGKAIDRNIELIMPQSTFLMDMAPRIMIDKKHLYGYNEEPRFYKNEQGRLEATWGLKFDDVEKAIEKHESRSLSFTEFAAANQDGSVFYDHITQKFYLRVGEKHVEISEVVHRKSEAVGGGRVSVRGGQGIQSELRQAGIVGQYTQGGVADSNTSPISPSPVGGSAGGSEPGPASGTILDRAE